jgi:PAB1-binding protein PBP1
MPNDHSLTFAGASPGFRTDKDISAGWQGRERTLQKWEATDNGTDVDLSLENGHVGGWDQFAAHKKMTGLESTYDENNYTTTINRSKPGFEEAERRAEKIAREIESSTATNAHVAEERGLKPLDDSGLDEEAK